MSNLPKQYPTIAAWTLRVGKNAEHWDMDAAIHDALNAMTENGYYLMRAARTTKGIPAMLNLADLPLAERP